MSAAQKLRQTAAGMAAVLARVGRDDDARAQAWCAGRLALVPGRWAAHIAREHARRGGVASSDACRWLLAVTEVGEQGAARRLPLSSGDDAIREAAQAAAREGVDVAALALGDAERGGARLWALLADHCARWGVEPAEPAEPAEPGDYGPALRRMVCPRWWLRRLRRAHARRCEGAAICGGVVRRGLWPYASQDTIERRQQQRRRAAAAMAGALVECAESGESVGLGYISSRSISNPEVKRSELMVRIRGTDEYAEAQGWACEFWTMTTPSRYHAQRILGATSDANPNYDGLTPKEAQAWLCKVWARWRAWLKRRGLSVVGLRTAEPHHDGTPHWHLIAYGPRADLRHARRVLRVYALRDCPDEPGARKHRFTYLVAKGGQAGARYAAKYVSKNINGYGLDNERDGETGRKVSSTVLRVDAWASAWGIRQFQFFGAPGVGVWRALRRMRAELPGLRGTALESARLAADAADWCGFWRAAVAGGLALLRGARDRLTQYGDAAAARVLGVSEGGRRALLPVKEWVIRWGAVGKGQGGGSPVGFGVSRSGVNNCTRPGGAPDFAGLAGLPEVFGGGGRAGPGWSLNKIC